MLLCQLALICAISAAGVVDATRHDRPGSRTRKDPESRRIYNGEETRIQDYPYQVQIVPMPKKPPKRIVYSSCGGAIISQRMVLTAGHCLRKGQHNPNKYLVRAGTSHRNGQAGSLHRVAEIRTHDNYLVYRRQHSHHDIAILVVDPPFQLDQSRQRIPIAVTGAVPGDQAISTGWGFVDLEKTVRPKTLQAVVLRVIDRESCNQGTNWRGMIDPNNFCAGVKGDSGSCKGDSGGPLAVNGRLVGVVSWGYSKRCARPGNPSVFTNVTAYVPWVQSQSKGEDVLYA